MAGQPWWSPGQEAGWGRGEGAPEHCLGEFHPVCTLPAFGHWPHLLEPAVCPALLGTISKWGVFGGGCGKKQEPSHCVQGH